ncbi:MAG: amino acid ABC transporter ATP-binding protein [Burkholderiaceae bacterium]
MALSESKVAPAGAILQIKGLHKHFGSTEILQGIDLTVRAGELVFIIGPSGSGKSTMLRCCNRLEEPSSGDILIEGTNLMAPSTDINAIRQRIGMVFQSFNLYPHLNALGNVALALRKVMKLPKDQAEAQALEALTQVGLADKTQNFPSQLSGGQQQRVAIARALALKPVVMLFDEPTSALDPELVGGVLKVMREMRESGMTMLVVSHEMRFARQAADRIVFMDKGEILEEGPPDQFFGETRHPRVKEFLSSLDH